MVIVTPSDAVRKDEVWAASPRRLSGHGYRTLAQRAQELADEATRGGTFDEYAEGGVVAEVEAQLRELLGAQAAVLMPSGTLAQQVALRIHADDRDATRVAMHPTSHPRLWEEQALEHVQHLDGARLWQCGPAYAPRSLADVVAMADTTYLSLYKDLGATAGAVLLCPEARAAEVRTWRHRLGGTQPALWPIALGARQGLRERLPRMPAFVAAAQALAAVVETVEPVRAAMLHVLLNGDPQRLADACVEVSAQSGVWLAGGLRPGPREATAVLEISVGEATLQVPPEEAATLLARVSDLAG